MRESPPRFDLLAFQVVSWPVLRDEVRFLEEMDIGTVWLADHYAWVSRPDDPLLEAWTTLAALAAATTRIRLGTLISNVAMRHPAMVAKQAATVDRISDGRLDLGLGPGAFAREHDWLGVPFLSPGGRVDRLREAVGVIDRLLRERRLSHSGTHYRLDDAPLVPAPVQQPRPPLVLAGQGKRALQVVADYADTWVSMGVTDGEGLQSAVNPLEAFRQRNRLLDEFCAASGRDPGTLERAYYAGWGEGEAPFVSSDAFHDFVGQYREAGVQRFIFTWSIGGIWDSAAAAGGILGRAALEAFAAQAMRELTAE